MALDPELTDPANDDFTPGDNMKDAGFPGEYYKGNSTSYLDLGGIQQEQSGGAAAGGTVAHGGFGQ